MKCIICGTEFEPSRKGNVYCVEACRIEGYRRGMRVRKQGAHQPNYTDRRCRMPGCNRPLPPRFYFHCRFHHDRLHDNAGAGMEGISVESGEWYLEEAGVA